jgi:hypothetical protein
MKALALASVLAALAFLLAGCGSSGSSNGSATAPNAPPRQISQDAFDKLQACLKNHGVTLPNGGPQGQPGHPQQLTPDAKMQNAFQACRQYAPSQPQGGFGG